MQAPATPPRDRPVLFTRHPANPILTAADWPVEVSSVFNPAACRTDTETALVCRVEDTSGLSHLWIARSADGIQDWSIDPEPLLSPQPTVETEAWGFEDPRIVHLDEIGKWAITCTAYGESGPAVYLATTDLRGIERHGLIAPPEDKNAALFPRRLGGEWVLLHRPVTSGPGSQADIWLSRSPDLRAWRAPERVIRTRPGGWWDSTRIGVGAPPLETDDGWLVIYHGVRGTPSGAIYRVGLALLDLDEPHRLLCRSPDWVLAPSEPYERVGDVPNVVFPCGAIEDEATDELRLYYGAADTCVALATARLSRVLDYLRAFPVPDART